MVVIAKHSGGIKLSWGAEHKDGKGNLISRQAMIQPPPSLTCMKFSCFLKYVLDSVTYSLVLLYHKRRVAYAEVNRGKKILERYRTGEPSPQTLWQAFHANIKLTCPICRRIERRR